MPIWSRGWRWFEPRVRSGSAGMKAAFVALGLVAAFCYLFLGPLVFDAGYWVLGKIARTAGDRRLRVGLSVAFVAVYLVVLGASGSTAKQNTATTMTPNTSASPSPGPTASALASAVAAETPVAPTATVTAPPATPVITPPPATPVITPPPATPVITPPPATPVVTPVPATPVVTPVPATPAPPIGTPTPIPGTRKGAVCKDGTTTDATGAGACSHHGGVDHWLYW